MRYGSVLESIFPSAYIISDTAILPGYNAHERRLDVVDDYARIPLFMDS